MTILSGYNVFRKKVEKVNLARAIVKIRENEIFALRKEDKPWFKFTFHKLPRLFLFKSQRVLHYTEVGIDTCK